MEFTVSVNHGKSWKMMLIKKYIEKNLFFVKQNGKNVPKMKMISKQMVKFRPWKTWRSHGKGHGKSSIFKSSKEYELWNLFVRKLTKSRLNVLYANEPFVG